MPLSKIVAKSITDDTITTDQIADTSVHGRRNLFHNSEYRVAQRGTSFASASTKEYWADRWHHATSGLDNAVFTVSRSTDTPSNQGIEFSGRLQSTTAESAVGSNDLVYLRYIIESQDLLHLNYGTSAAESLTLSFWVYSSSNTGNFLVDFYQSDSNRNQNKTYTINATNTWEYKTITLDGDTGGSGFNADTGYGLGVHWVLLAGTDWGQGSTTNLNTWGTYAADKFANGFTATSPFLTTNGVFMIAGPQLEVGTRATPLERRGIQEESLACYRYYYDGRFGSNDGPVSSPGRDAQYGHIRQAMADFPVPMRAGPSVTIQSSSANCMDRYGRGQETCYPKAENIHPEHFQNVVKYTSSAQTTTATWTDSGNYINRAGYKADAEY